MGASAELLERALCQDFTLLLSVALVPEYEEYMQSAGAASCLRSR